MDYIVLIKYVPDGGYDPLEWEWSVDGVFKTFEEAYLYKTEQEAYYVDCPDSEGNFYFTIEKGE